MKRKLLVSVCVLAMAASSFGAGEILVGDFEDGSMDGWWASGWGGTSAAPAEAYPSTGGWSLKADMANGGWEPLAEFAVMDQGNSAQLQSALATVGQISVDVTSFYNTGSSNDYSQLCVYVNIDKGDGTNLWNAYGYNGVSNGSMDSFVFQLPQDAMDLIALAPGYVNVGFLGNHSGTESYVDGETGETIVTFDGAITYYIDNVQVVPEPATLSLLGVGALALIRRKR